jgi:hypothetical protein
MWTPISLDELNHEISDSEAEMNADHLGLWQQIRINPEKWQLSPWGDLGGGFWVVGILGRKVIWYNDIEDGFDISHYDSYGIIGEYLCNQLELHHAIYRLWKAIAEKTA